VQSTVLDNNSVYPVSDELSTFIPFDSMIRISAGIFLPSSIFTTSPRTSFIEDIDFYTPPRMTVISGGIKFLNDYINALLFRFCINSTRFDMLTIAIITIPKYRLDGSSEAIP